MSAWWFDPFHPAYLLSTAAVAFAVTVTDVAYQRHRGRAPAVGWDTLVVGWGCFFILMVMTTTVIALLVRAVQVAMEWWR